MIGCWRRKTCTRITRYALAMLIFGIAGCSTLPVEDIRTYALAYRQVHDAGDLILDQIAPIVTAESKKSAQSRGNNPSPEDCRRTETGYPQCFDPDLVLAAPGDHAQEDASIQSRRVMLASVAHYNGILLDLAEGRSVADVQGRVDELAKLASVAASLAAAPSGGLTALGPSAAGLLSGLAGRLEAARANAAVRRSLISSKDDIQAVYQLLIKDTPQIYRIYRAAKEIEIFKLSDLKIRARLDNDAARQSALERQIGEVESQIAAYHASLGAYVQLLCDASAGLDALVQVIAGRRLFPSIQDATALAREAAALRARTEAALNLLRAVREPATAANQ